MPKHWYKIYIGECPVCGRDKSFRVRVYGKKPPNPAKRYLYMTLQECYDWCDLF